MAGPGFVATAVLLLLCWGTHQINAQAVSIMVVGSPPPGFTPGPDEYRAASGPFTFTCTATGGAGSGDYDYVWTTTCNISDCEFVTSSTGTTSVISRMALHSGDGGTHTCTASREGESGSGSDTVTVNIVGVGIAVFAGSGMTGTMPNNGLVISTNPGSGIRFFFECRSNSSTVGVGEFIGLNGSPIVDETNNFFRFRDTVRGGELSIENAVNSETLLSTNQQGVYTCRMPFEGGEEGEFNIGIYPNGFNTMPSITNPLMFTRGSPSSTLTCTSTGSVATTVTFVRDSTTVGPLRDGESMDFGDVTYQLTQTVTNRVQSTYRNVLTINQPLSDIEDSTFTCSVANAIGTSSDSQDITVNAIDITSPAETPTVGGTAAFTCTSLLGQADTIEWLLVDGTVTSVVMNSGQSTLDLVLDPVSESMNGGVYRCRVTISGATVDQDVTVTVQVPDVTVLITPSGSAVVGMSYALTCTVSGTDNLVATISIVFTGPNADSGSGTSLELPLDSLDLNDAGEYTCTATVSSGLLINNIVRTDTEEVNIPIPSLSVDVRQDGGTTIYAGSMLTLTCRIFVVNVPPNLDSGVVVTTAWLGASGNPFNGGATITVNPAEGSIDTVYISTVVFNTVRTNNGGTYTCQATATHSSQFITGVTTPGEVTISPIDPTLELTVMSSTTRLPNVGPYNIFTLTCTATAPPGVVEPKTFTWRRTMGSGVSCGSFGVVMNGGNFQIANSDVDQPESTSELTVTETTAAMWRYCCQASLFEMPVRVTGSSDEISVTVTGPVQPQQPTNLMDIGTNATSTMIRWTVPMIAYTPETYVVNYGTNMSSLNLISAMVMSGSDFEAVNQVFSVALTGLVDTTTYFYQVVATNGQGSTSSDVQSFDTTILRNGPPQNFTLTMRTTTSLSFSWDPPALRAGVDVPTRYIVRCEPQLEGIDTPPLVDQSATQLTVTVMGLFSGVTYSCSVAAVNDQGEGDKAAPQSGTTLETAPTGQPQNFDITPGESGDTSRNLTFFWDLPPPTQRNGIITSYTISCTPDAETLPLVETTVTLPGVEGLTVGGFRPFTEYTCAIVATNSQGSGPPATIITTTNEDAPDGPPQSPSVTTTGNPERLNFTVQPPQAGLANGVIRSYRVRCIPTVAFPSAAGVNVMISSASAEVGGFTPAADYMCFFAASTSAGMGPETTTGLDVTTLPNAPNITSVMNQSAFEVLVEWTISVPDGLPGAITHFTVYVDNSAVENTADGTVLSYTISNLAPFQLVMVEVSASTSAGEGARSAAMSGRSSEASSGPVSNVVLDSPSASMVVVSWGPPQMPNGIILNYTVVLERYQDGFEVDRRDIDGNTFVVEFDDSQNIEAEVPFNLTIFARNSVGEGQSVELIHFTVESTSPPPPSGVRVSRSTDGRSMTVSWTRLTIVEARSFVTYIVTFEEPNSRRKRQSGATCTSSPCEVDGSLSSVMITGLDPGTSYNVQVTTMNGGGAMGTGSPVMVSQGVSSSSSIAGIIGGVVGGIVAVIVIVAIIIVVCYCVRHRKQTKYAPHYGDYGMDAKKVSTRPEPLARAATKSFMQSEEELATFDPTKAPAPSTGTESQSIERLRPIPVPSFTQHVLEMHQDRDKHFELEYQSISNDPLATYDVAKLPFNKAKNRFANIFPYDFCRVKLKEIEGVEGSDYVNASYVDGYNHPNAYVAAQGPLPNTVTDFWRMVWEHRLNTIVMLTKSVEAGKRKCEQYWPENVNENFDPPNSSLQITLTSIQPFADYEIKKFLIKDNAQPDVPPLSIMHYHFLGWPDHGVPKFATSLIGFIRRVRKEHNKDGPPMLVHCSAGVGRTGTFILLDSMLERMKAENSVNVYEFLRNMRAKRVFMVQTLAQYTFIHDALEELINCGDTSIVASNLRVKVNRLHKVLPGKAISGFEDQFKLLDHVSRKPCDNDCSDAVQPYNKAKNRYLDRIPYNLSRTRLRPTGVTGAEYINGSFVDGYKQRNTYIATQAPLQETVVDFWRMIWEFKSKAIVMLCSAEENGQQTSYPYWAMKLGETEIFGKLQVTLASEEPTKDFIIRKFEIKEDKVGQGGLPGFTVTQFHVTQWPEHGRPPSSNTVLGLVEQLIKVQRGTGNRSITVMCNDGMGRTGTFICIHAQLERVKTEGVVDFFQFIKSSRIHRPSLVSGLEQYIFCHDALADYLDSFDTYANFKDFGPK